MALGEELQLKEGDGSIIYYYRYICEVEEAAGAPYRVERRQLWRSQVSQVSRGYRAR